MFQALACTRGLPFPWSIFIRNHRRGKLCRRQPVSQVIIGQFGTILVPIMLEMVQIGVVLAILLLWSTRDCCSGSKGSPAGIHNWGRWDGVGLSSSAIAVTNLPLLLEDKPVLEWKPVRIPHLVVSSTMHGDPWFRDYSDSGINTDSMIYASSFLLCRRDPEPRAL